MTEMILQNWLSLLPIIILSVLAVGLIIERVLFFISLVDRNKTGVPVSIDLLHMQQPWKVEEMLKDRKDPQARILLEGIRLRNQNIMETKNKLEAFANKQVARMERNLSFLPGIANIATLLGLFGTVTGMILTFYTMKVSGSSDPYVLAGGISQALLTTAFGLAAAIPSLIAYNVFNNIINSYTGKMENLINEILAVYSRKTLFPL